MRERCKRVDVVTDPNPNSMVKACFSSGLVLSMSSNLVIFEGEGHARFRHFCRHIRHHSGRRCTLFVSGEFASLRLAVIVSLTFFFFFKDFISTSGRF